VAKAKNNKAKISFIGNNASGVTGSMTLIEFMGKKILLECGLFQDGSVFDTYKINSKRFDFKAKDIDYCFVNHVHTDHIALLPKLIKDGFNGRIIVTSITAKIAKPLLYDSAYIIKRDAEFLSKRRKENVDPIYEEYHVDKVFNIMYEYGYDEIYELDDYIHFKFLKNSHIVGAAQLELFLIDDNKHTHKLLYTSDLGSFKFKKPFVDETEVCKKSNIVIVESTYGNATRSISKKQRETDIQKLKTIVEDVCIDRNGRVLIPTFSLDRTQFILKFLYDIFGNNEDFKVPIIIDSPLSCAITKIYQEISEDGLIDEILSWKNVRLISESDESKASVKDKSPKVVLSSSGFLQAGRAVKYLKEYLPNENDFVLFVGYASPTSLAGRIKNSKDNKTITIEGKPYKNKCSVMCLNSFSSHIQKDEIINYMKQCQSDKIYLVHGDEAAKLELKHSLEEELKNMGRTTRVIVTHKGLVCNF
jgi:metallo-beta-lactamase family protein